MQGGEEEEIENGGREGKKLETWDRRKEEGGGKGKTKRRKEKEGKN